MERRGGRGGFGGLLGGYRRAAGLTQQQLAALAGFSVAALRDLEQGRTRWPRPESAQRLARALSLNPAQTRQLLQAARRSARPAAADQRDRGPAPAAAGQGMCLQVLGPLAAWRDGALVELGAPKQRAVLGLLAVRANTVVHRDALIDAIWGEHPPATAVNLVQSYASRLRRALDPSGEVGLLVGVGTSYRLRLDANQLDLLGFGQLVERGRECAQAGDPEVACQWYRQALGLWQGEPLADVDQLRGHPAVVDLDRRRTATIAEYAELAIATGLAEQVIPHLERLAERESLDERAHALLMLALAGSGQQATALHLYEKLRRRLDDQLGIHPGAELSDAHLRVLRQQVPGSSRPARQAVPARVVPRQLPAAVRHFAGRADELKALGGLLDQTPAGGAVVISAIGGTAGVGKTALAIHFAHQVVERFPDGQLYANLRGFDPTGIPMTPAEAIRGLLDALEVAPEQVPAGLDAQAGLYRSRLAGRRMLVVLDNARDEQQVRPLLPASPTCLVLVTSRHQLTGLVTCEGAHPLTLDLLSSADARELLARRLGGERVAAEPAAVDELVGLCARLPLALSIAAARAATQPTLPLAALAAELRHAHARLDALDTGEATSSMRAVLSWSYQQLAAPAARLFRLLGLHPGPDVSALAAASLAAIAPQRANQLLRGLARAHLLAEHTPGRFAFHDLLRAYAAEQARSCDSEEERHAALTRLFDHYLAGAAAAMDTLVPAEQHRRPRIPAPATPLPPVGAAAAARAWLDAERASLVAVTTYTAGHGWPEHTTRLAATLFRYLDRGGHHADAVTVHTRSLHAARQTGDRGAQANTLISLGQVLWLQGRYRQAAHHLQQALALYGELGDRLGQARTLANLGLVEWHQGRYRQAAQHRRRALAIYRELGDRLGQARTLNNLGMGDLRQGRYQRAADHHREALVLFREIGDRDGEACALDNLGVVDLRQGRYQQAGDHHQQALILFREIGYRDGEAEALDHLGLVDRHLGRHQRAIDHHQQALAIYREIGDRDGEAEALNGVGEALVAAGRPEQARARHRDALALASQIGDRYQRARAYDDLAHAHHASGDHDQARRHWQHALTVYTKLGVPEAGQVRARLAGMDGTGRGRDGATRPASRGCP
jgi:DNA-binding SARP family transcriptional activator/Tfp pilus assembly protein PilF/DNA-binding XRE family transcriptional regulator